MGTIFDDDKELESLGIIEFADWIYTRERIHPNNDRCESEVHSCLKAHLDSSIKQVAWSLGRSVMLYQSENSLITRFGEKADETAMRPGDLKLAGLLKKECFLRSALKFGHENGMTIIGHLCMNRHYGGAYGNCLTSLLARKNDMWEINKDGKPDTTRLCFALEDYCQERLAIIHEVALLGIDGLLLDFVRQPPMIRYHSCVVDPYQKRTGRDPRRFEFNNVYPDGKNKVTEDIYLDWFRYRSGVLTRFMRMVRKVLREIELESERRVPLSVRITDAGFTANLISGVDIETWCEEGLIDCIVTHPLQWIHGIWIHDARPYVNLGHHSGVKVMGGINTYPVQGWMMNPVCIAMRIKKQYDAGVAGISLYETNDAVLRPEMADLLKAIYRYDDLATLLSDKNWLQKWPINGFNANCGMDNHSGFSRDLLQTL